MPVGVQYPGQKKHRPSHRRPFQGQNLKSQVNMHLVFWSYSIVEKVPVFYEVTFFADAGPIDNDCCREAIFFYCGILKRKVFVVVAQFRSEFRRLSH